jgi:hypothetical protein
MHARCVYEKAGGGGVAPVGTVGGGRHLCRTPVTAPVPHFSQTRLRKSFLESSRRAFMSLVIMGILYSLMWVFGLLPVTPAGQAAQPIHGEL